MKDADRVLLEAFQAYIGDLHDDAQLAAEYRTTAQEYIRYLQQKHEGRHWFGFLRDEKAASEFTSGEYAKNQGGQREQLQAFQHYLHGHGRLEWVAAWVRTQRERALLFLSGLIVTALITVGTLAGWVPWRRLRPQSPVRTTVPAVFPTIAETPLSTPTVVPTPNLAQILSATLVPTANPSFTPVARTMADGTTQVWVPAGSFVAGDQYGVGYEDERPPHQVYTDGFWIDRFPVTNAQFGSCPEEVCGKPKRLGSHKRSAYFGVPTYNNYPVIEVTWQQACDYCQRRGGRLPTEAEFEKAAGWDPRTGNTLLYPWGDRSPDETLANFNGVDRDTTPVDACPAGISPVGAYDMAGNVWQWTASWFSKTFYSDNCAWINPIGPLSGERRVVKGGSWYVADPGLLRVANRGMNAPDNAGNEIGFRCAFDK